MSANKRECDLESGFTLLELLIAVTLVAVMAVGVWAALDLCVKAWMRGIDAIDSNQRERSTRDLVRKQIASAYPLVQSSTASSVTQGEAAARTATVRSSSATLAPVFLGGETGLRFVSPNSLLSMDSAGLVMVTYEAEVDSDGNIVLMEREAPYMGQGADDGGFTSSIPVFYNLKECIFEYYYPGDADNPAEWLTEWDAASRRRLPAAVRISMLFRDADKDSPGIQMIIPLRAQYNYLQVQPQQQQRVQRGQPQQRGQPGQQQGGQPGQEQRGQSPRPKGSAN
ncbi:MAG: prepilin-type N-terminal cleavage/methylation domain-containing protein [Acidobacteriota bacterium]|jgi:prepilin-type N-terminal cleavage/methylation domain-containing protein|nr:prepilin-type N-terminal cleavage/methylation domain-containing protein [Acidobacteriota bacterium]